ncbi:MAG: YidC/Oxa1 family membrane protein insertase [Eubacteriales bacterium]|nr:YidC/Oxa1 family membrane protein insertase [Eubacteriales bacterium]
MFLTQEGGLLGPLSFIFGKVMNLIFIGLDKIGIGNVGIAIILFTIFTRILLYPFTQKQQKQSRMMSYIQPEVSAIQEKYKDRKDQESIMAMQRETKAVYEKYGTSMTGSCLQLLIQMPIIFALYRVIMRIPAYVDGIKNHYINIINAFGGTNREGITKVAYKITEIANGNKALTGFISRSNDLGLTKADGIMNSSLSFEQIRNYIIDFLYNLNPTQMNDIAQNFNGAIQNADYETSVTYLNNANLFLGMNLSTSPWDGWRTTIAYVAIPILAGASQYFSAKLMMAKKKATNPLQEEDQMQQTMKSMNIMMPLMSLVFCFTFATGIGIYWITTSVLMVAQQIFINNKLDSTPIEEMIKENIRKANKKRAKKGMAPLDENVTAKKIIIKEKKEEEQIKQREEKIKLQEEKTKKSENYYFDNNENSIFAKMNMVKKYNEKNNKE